MIVAAVQIVVADIGQIVIGIIALIFLVIRQLMEANKAAGAPRMRPQVPPPAPPQPAGKGAVPMAGQQADPLRAQVEEFLRRAGRPVPQEQQQPVERSGEGSPERGKAIDNDASRLAADRAMGEPLRQAAWRAKQPATTPKMPTPAIRISDKPRSQRGSGKPRRRQSVAEHVAEQVTAHTQSLGQKASQLGQRIAVEDQQFDVQLKAKFDHTIGTLAGTAVLSSAEQTPPSGDTPAAQLAALLANPNGIQQAVLVNEILRRPSERW
jgi:hypothetical protein